MRESYSFGARKAPVLALILALVPFTPAWSQTSGSAIVTGRIHNAATSAYLEAVRVQVEGTNNTALTDRQGRYRISVPAGRVTLVFSFTGLDPERITVDVGAGQTLERDIALTSEVYRLEEYTVAGMREGLALATALQKEAPNVKNVVASDTFGNIADGNVGDFLQRLPGITANYVGPEVRSVSIRGINADLNSVTQDGIRVASSQSAGLGRQFEMEQASLGMVEMLEVTKAPTPDMDADSIGGSVNLVSKSPFDRAQPRFVTYSVGGVYRTKDRKKTDHLIGPSASVMYSNVVGPNDNIGVMLNAAYNFNPGGSSGGAASLIDYGQTLEPTYIWRVRAPRPAGAAVTRATTGMKLDFKHSESTTFSFSSAYNFFHESNDTRTFNLEAQRNDARFAPGFSEVLTQVLPHNNNFADINIRIDDKSGRTYSFQPSGRHNFGDTKIDYTLSYSNSKTYYEESAQGNGNRFYTSRPKGRVNMRLRNIGWIVDRRQDARWPTYQQTAGPDMYDLNNYDRLRLQHLDRWGEDEIRAATFNFTRELDIGLPFTLKTGLSYREQDRHNERNYKQYFYAGPDGIVGSADDNLMQFFDTSGQYDRPSYTGNRHLPKPPWPDPYAVARHHFENPHLYDEDMGYRVAQNLQGRRFITETVSAAYLMGNARFGKLSVLTGVRVERTKAEGEGPLQTITPEERARRNAWVGPVTAEEAARRSYEEWHRRDRSEGGYTKTFPGVHLRYEGPLGTTLRASWSTGIGRPGFGTLIPLNNVNYENEFVQVNNTGLRPQFSDNFDVSVEKYFEPVGLVSFGAFYKNIKDYIYNTRGTIIGTGPDNGFGGEYAGYELRSQANGGYAKVKGLEANYQQQLSFLPGWWSGFGVYANGTYLQTEGDFGGTEQRSTSQIPGFLPRTANIGVSYVQHGLDVRLQTVWRGRYLVSYNANPALLAWQEAHTRFDLKSKYRISPAFNLFLDVENIFEDPLNKRYTGRSDRPTSTVTWPAKIVFGVSGRL